MNKRDNESWDDELLSVKDILEEFLGSKPEVIDLTFDSEFEVSRPSPIKATRLLRGLTDWPCNVYIPFSCPDHLPPPNSDMQPAGPVSFGGDASAPKVFLQKSPCLGVVSSP